MLAVELLSSCAIIKSSKKIQVFSAVAVAFLLGVGYAAVVLLAENSVASSKAFVTVSIAQARADQISQILEDITIGVHILESFVLNTDNCSYIESQFAQVSRGIIDTHPQLYQVGFDVSGVTGMRGGFVYPPFPASLSNLYNWNTLNNTDSDTSHDTPAEAKRRIGTENGIYLIGPQVLFDGLHGIFARKSLWKHADAYVDDLGCNSHPTDCEAECWNESAHMKYFGSIATVYNMDDLLRSNFRMPSSDKLYYEIRVASVGPDDYNYAYRDTVLASTPRRPIDPVTAEIKGYNIRWILHVSLKLGWVPAWRDPLLVFVAFIAFIIVTIVLRLMVIHERHGTLIGKMLPEKVIKHLELGRGAFAESFDTVTILFADIVDYTIVCSRLTPLQVVLLLDELYKTFDALVVERGVYKGNYIPT